MEVVYISRSLMMTNDDDDEDQTKQVRDGFIMLGLFLLVWVSRNESKNAASRPVNP